MISIVDYGLGNILAFVNAYKRLNINVSVSNTPGSLKKATKLILPGVGDFDYAMRRLDESNLRDALDELVLHKKVPVIGICVGMHMLSESSEEGSLFGLGWINGQVKALESTLGDDALPLPHMGWNDIHPCADNKLFDQLCDDARFYFLHSYYFECDSHENVAAVTNYGQDFCCAINSENIYGVQFHPEKSHHFGARLLKNFAEL